MANSTIGGLPAVTDVIGTDEYILYRSGASKKIDAVDLVDAIVASVPASGAAEVLASTSISSSANITATTSATANTVMTAASVSLDGSTDVTIELYASSISTPGGAASRGVVVEVWDSFNSGTAASIGVVAQVFNATSAVIHAPCFVSWRPSTPASGTHVYSIRAWVHGGTGVVTAGAGGAATVVPATLRVLTSP